MGTIGERIKQAREDLGISQPELARRCGWDSQSRISQYETDAREARLDDLKRIAKALNRHLYWIISGDELVKEAPHDHGLPDLLEFARALVAASPDQIDVVLATLGLGNKTLVPPRVKAGFIRRKDDRSPNSHDTAGKGVKRDGGPT